MSHSSDAESVFPLASSIEKMKLDCQFDKSKAIKLLDLGLGITNEEKTQSGDWGISLA